MAVQTIIIPVGAATLPDGTTNNAAPGFQRVKSSGSDPKPHFIQLAFDTTTKEMCMWSFRLPGNYLSGPVLKVQYKMTSATTGNVGIIGKIAAVTPGDATDTDAKAFDSDNSSGASAVPGTTAGKLAEISLALTNNDSLAAGDYVVLYLARDVSVSSNAAGDMEVVGVAMEYTS